MNGERPQVNGQHLLNGATSTQHHQATEAKISRIDPSTSQGKQTPARHDEPYTNGVLPNGPTTAYTSAENGLQQVPLEVLQLIGKENYLPMSTVISRTAQTCWNKLSILVDQLSAISVPTQSSDPSKPHLQAVNNQTKANLDKKERILEFAKEQKDDFIKLLVLLQWSKNSEEVNKLTSLAFWLRNRRMVYEEARRALAVLKEEAHNFQIQNPDLATAAEVLSLGKVKSFPNIGYKVTKPLRRKQILSTLRRLSRTVTIRLALEDSLPLHLRNYRVQDGRATFVVQNEFEVDLSVVQEAPTAPFRIVDFRFTFSPQPTITKDKRQEIEFIANAEIDKNGLLGCYDFFHNLAITTKLTELYRQAAELSRDQWAGHLRAEVLRRDLVVEYWRGGDPKKSWIEISVHSGRVGETYTSVLSQPHLAVRWFRVGKEVKDFELDMDLAEISFESVLLQIVAQHINQTLDSVYERLTSATLFTEGGLLVELSASTTEPKDCVLEIQMAKDVKVVGTIDPVTGSIMLSPASDRAKRLQADLNRAKVKGEDLVPLILSYRCALAETSVFDSIKGTSWERLDAFRPPVNELRALLGSPALKVNFFRHPRWSNRYLLAVTHNFSGDRALVIYRSAQDKAASLAQFRIVQEQPLHLDHGLSTRFFDDFADYASGIVALHCNAEQLQSTSPCYRLPRIPDFEEDYVLPVLLFEVAGGKFPQPEKGSKSLASAVTVRVSYQGAHAVSKLSCLSVELRCQMEAVILERLAASNPDAHITFSPSQRLVSLEVETMIGEPSIEQIVQKVTRLNDVMACIRVVQSLTSTTLASVSMLALTIDYNFGENVESRMLVQFPSSTEAPQLAFLPPGTDPHECLVPHLSQLLTDSSKSFSANLSSVLSSLNLTHSLVMALKDLQPHTLKIPESTGGSKEHLVHLHVLARQPTMFALHFFTSPSKGLVEKPTASTNERLLARFEILPSRKYLGQWLLRPAMEEINAYTRASFASTALRDRVRDEIFGKKGSCPDWIRLDVAAVCLKDKPHPLLNTLHGLIVDWVKSNPAKVEELPVVEKTTSKPQPKPAPATNANGNVNTNRKPSGQASKPLPNAVANNMQRKNMGNVGSKNPPKNKEVITLD
jgi:mediator of RNA polymerase II transcription subunit 14